MSSKSTNKHTFNTSMPQVDANGKNLTSGNISSVTDSNSKNPGNEMGNSFCNVLSIASTPNTTTTTTPTTTTGKDMRYAKDALEKLEALRNQEVTISEEIHDNLTTTTTSKRELNVTITKLENDIVYLKDEEKEQKILIQKLRTNVASINLEVTDTNNRLKDIAKLNEDMGTEKENLIITIAELKNKLNGENGLKYIYENDSNELEQTKQQIDECESKIRYLQDIQGRASRFATKKLRDTFLKKNITELQQSLSNISTTRTNVESNINKLENKDIPFLEDKIDKKDALCATFLDTIASYGEELNILKEKRNEATESRKILWNEQSQLTNLINNNQSILLASDRLMKSTMPPSLASGLSVIERLSNEVEGVYGPLLGLMEPVQFEFYTAIEVVGGNSLFHVVVQDEDVAEYCMKELEKQRAGRVTFIPLNRIRRYKNNNVVRNQDGFPLMDKITPIDDKFLPAFQQIFGRTMCCRSMEIAAKYALEKDVDCITLEGDEARRRGVFCGGSRGADGKGASDNQKSRLLIFKNINQLQDEKKTERREDQKEKENQELHEHLRF